MRSAFLFFPSLYLFVLPIAHVNALRSLGFVGTLALAAYVWLKERPSLPLKAPFAFWLLVALASLFTAIDARYSLHEIRGDVVYGIATFYAFYLLTRSSDDLGRWRAVTAGSLLLLGVLAVISYARHGEWVDGYQNFLGEYATFTITALPLIVSVFAPGPLRGSRPARYLAAAGLCLGLAGGFLTRSRALWGVLVGSSIVGAVLYSIKHGIRLRIPLLISAAMLAIGIGAAAFVSSERGIDVDYFGDRTPIYSFVLRNIASHPLYGTGFGREANRAAYRKALPNSIAIHAHSLPLSYMEQMGVWGLIVVVWLFGALLARFWRAWRSPAVDEALVGMTGLTLLAAVALKNVTDMFFTSHLLLLFCAHTGLLLGYLARRKAPVLHHPPG